MKEFGLNPLHYVSIPGYSFDCWLMSSGVTLDTLQDKQMLDAFLEAKRGGICGIMGDRYVNGGTRLVNIIESNETLWYIEANKLYSYAMMQKLPCNDLEYQGTCFADTDTSLTSLDNGGTTLRHILNTPDDSDHGNYIICDINYTNSCNDITEQLALMPNERTINKNELGYREREKGTARTEKLIFDQNNKTEYMVHFRRLKFFVKMGGKVTKIHKVIKFIQDYICRDCIQNKTNERATAKSEAEKDVRKIMNNSLYGKMRMNLLHFFQGKFLQDEEKIMKSISKPTFKNITRCKV